MDIDSIRGKIELIRDDRYVSIIMAIVEAVNDYPIFELLDTDEYFAKVQRYLNVAELNLGVINQYLARQIAFDLWEHESLNSLAEAFKLYYFNIKIKHRLSNALTPAFKLGLDQPKIFRL